MVEAENHQIVLSQQEGYGNSSNHSLQSWWVEKQQNPQNVEASEQDHIVLHSCQ